MKNPDVTVESLVTSFGEPKFIGAQVFSPAEFTGNVSPDGRALTALLDECSVELSSMDGEKYGLAKVAILQVPVLLPTPLNETFLGFHVRIAGFVDKTPGARAAIHVELGGGTKEINFPYGSHFHENFQDSIFSFASTGNIELDPTDSGNIPSVPAPPAPQLSALIILSVQRRAVQDTVLLRLDTIDIEINQLRKTPVQ